MNPCRPDPLWDAVVEDWEQAVEKRVQWLEAVALVMAIEKIRVGRQRAIQRARERIATATKSLELATADHERVVDVLGTAARLAAVEGEWLPR